MAQLVVRVPARHEVMGSNPDWSVTFFIVENIPALSGRLAESCFVSFPDKMFFVNDVGACTISSHYVCIYLAFVVPVLPVKVWGQLWQVLCIGTILIETKILHFSDLTL